MNIIEIDLPVNRDIASESFSGFSRFQLNLETKNSKVKVHFWRPSVNENGKHFITIKKTDKARFIKACASTLK
jgi:hypothetical protein